jgi:polyphosphate kinase
VPGVPRRLSQEQDPFEAIRAGDVLLHHPYESFAPVLDLVRSAASDPNVVAVKQTLYRTGADSPVAEALLQAARNGKEVTAVIELRARFDEAANIDLATRLQQAGAKVVYGIVAHKIHAKMLLIVRREGRHLRRYAHLGTGNYHARTARAYTDLSLFTCDRELCEDVHRLFLQLTGLGRVASLRKLVQAPFHLQDELLALIAFETAEARAGRPARIAAKMNALSEPRVIQALYAASQAGVPIDLVVRGICCLRPGVPGVSETVRVRSIVGQFLEHTRAFCFHHAGADLTFASSADWMQRNFYSRVETCFPIEDPALARRVREECLEACLADDTQAWLMDAQGKYARAVPRGARRTAQQDLLARHAG